MATIGSISIAFEANLRGLETGIEDVIDLFDDISETVDDLSEKLDGVAQKKINIKATADTSAVKKAAKDVDDLEKEVEKKKPKVSIGIDRDALASLGKQFASSLGAQLKSSGDGFVELGKNAGGTFKAIGSAANGVGSVLDGTATSLEGVIVAVSRSQSAFEGWNDTVERVGNATSLFVRYAGGLTTITGALAGNIGSGARVLASFGAVTASAAAGMVTYAGVMALTRVATAGMSDEARAAVEGWVSLGAAMASSAVGAQAGLVAFGAFYSAMAKSSTSVELFANLLKQASDASAAFASTIVSNLGRILNVLGLVTVASGKFSKQMEAMGGQAEGVRNMSDRFGSTTEQVQVLSFAAESAGVSMGQLVKAQQAFFTNVSKVKVGQLNVDTVKEAKFAFDKLGVSVDDLRNRSPQQVFALVAERLERVEDASDRAAIAFDLFGKQGGNILPALKGLKEAASDASRLGTVMSQSDFKMFEGVDQSFDRLKQASGNLSQTMMVAFAPLQTGFNNLMAELKGGLVAALGPIRSAMAAATVPLQVFMEVTGRLLNMLLRGIGVVAKFFVAMSNSAALAPAWRALGDVVKYALGFLEQLLSMAEAVADAFTAEMAPAIDDAAKPLEKLIFAAKTFATVIVGAGVASAIMQSFGIQAGAAFMKFAAGLKAVSISAVFGKIIGFLKLLTVDVAATAAKWVASFTLMGVTAIANFVTPFIASVATVITGNAAIATSATVTGYAMAAAWVIGTLGIAAVIVAIVAVIQNFDKLYDYFANFGDNIGRLMTFEGLVEAAGTVVEAIKNAFISVANFVGGFFGNIIQGIIRRIGGIKTPEKIDAASASVSGVIESRQAQQKAAFDSAVTSADMVGKSTADIKMPVEDVQALSDTLGGARDEMIAMSLNAAKFGEMGRKAFLEANSEFGKLQQQFADNTISLDEFEKKTKEIQGKLKENLKLADVLSPEQLQQSAENMRKTVEEAFSQVRGVMRGVDLGSDLNTDRFFPASDEIKKQAEQFANSYQDELIKIEEALQRGDFGKGQDALKAAEQEREKAKQKFDRNMGKIEADVSFASEIRKALEDAFLTPVQKFEKELEKIQSNKSLTDQEKSLATVMKQREMVEGTFGKSAGASLREKEAMFANATAVDQYGRTAFMSSEGSRAAGDARASAERNNLDIERRKAVGLDATAAQQLKAGADNIADIFGVAGKSIQDIEKELGPEKFAEYQEAIKKNSEAVKASLGIEKTGAEKLAEVRRNLSEALAAGVISEEERTKALKEQRDSFLQSMGITKSPVQEFEDAVALIKENASELSKDEIAKGLKAAKDKLLQALGIDKSPLQAFEESMKDLNDAAQKRKISDEEFAKGAQKAKDTLLQSLGIPLDPVKQLGQRMKDLDEALAARKISDEEYARGQEEARRAMLPGGDEESPVKVFERSMKQVREAASQGLISPEDLTAREDNLRAQLQEDLKPALDNLGTDRRGIGAADARSQAGVDTFFRILRGRDNPSLKAQIDTAKYTKQIAEAAANADAAPVIAQLSAT